MRSHRSTASMILLLAMLAGAWGDGPRGQGRTDPPPTPYWRDGRRGWHFYEDPAADEAIEAATPIAVPATRQPAEAARPEELVAFERLQRTLEDLRNIAVMRPTEANVRRYMELESRVVQRASIFADMAQRVAWATPALDPTLHGRPVNAQALEVFERQQAVQRSGVVAALRQDHVLLFFYRSDCPYCHAVAPTLQSLQARHGLQVVAISLDGGPLPGFPQARADNGIARSLQVDQVPAVFLAQPFTGRITPIGFGVLSESQLLERLASVGASVGEVVLPGAPQRPALP